MNKPIFLEDLASICYSSRGSIQGATLYDENLGEDIDGGTVEYLIETYPRVEVTRIQAYQNDLVFYVNVDRSGEE